MVFAKKSQTKNIAGAVYTTKVESFTHGKVYDVIVAKQFLGPEDKVLIIDDFLANGAALEGLIDLVHQAGGPAGGGRHRGGEGLPSPAAPGCGPQGIRVESLAKIKSMSEETGVEFED